MSQPNSKSASTGRGLFVRRAEADVYTVMLVLSLVALILGSVMLAFEVKAIDPTVKVFFGLF